MIKENTLENLRKWFTDYVRDFYTKDSLHDQNIALKEQHTHRVCEEIVHLGKSLMLDSYLLQMAQIAALFHDLGRFEQYARYKTFADQHSENHAELGLKVLNDFGLLKDFGEEDRKIVLDAVAFHNKAEIPQDTKGNSLLIAKMLRDADKLDIWKVVTDYYTREDRKQNKSIELDLPDNETVSEKIFQDALAGRIISSADVKTLNDFKFLQMGWVFDLNFKHSLIQVKQRNYIKFICDSISDEVKAKEVFAAIAEYLNKKLSQDSENLKN